MPIKPSSQLLVVLIIVLSNLAIIRELGRGRLRLALDKVFRGAQILVHPRTWFKVFKVVTAPEMRSVVGAAPRIALKYLGRYLGEGLSLKEKASIFIDHYTFLKVRVEQDFFRKIVDGRIKLWEHVVSNRLYRICVTFSKTHNNEGDLSLIFEADHIGIYTLSFTIGPGSIAGLTADQAIYIGRVQGKGKGLQLIRIATKDCLDISPAALLLAAVEGIANSLELDQVVGIGAGLQISASLDSRPEGLVHAYDEFWMALGGVKLERNMFLLSVPLPEKPIKEIKQHHRARTLRKRRFKALVSEQVFREFSAVAMCLRDEKPTRELTANSA